MCWQIPHLVELGVTAVELLPVFEYDELEFQRAPNPRDHMVNIWGYSHLSFLAPISRSGPGPGAPPRPPGSLSSWSRRCTALALKSSWTWCTTTPWKVCPTLKPEHYRGKVLGIEWPKRSSSQHDALPCKKIRLICM